MWIHYGNPRCIICTLKCLPHRIAMVLVIVCWCFTATYCQRRIVNGTVSVGEPRYLAYFVKAPQSIKKYIGWVCGGTIIHPLYILTSAACLNDVKYVYAIIGYNRYVKPEDIDRDQCTKRVKKRVVAKSFQKENNPQPSAHNWSSRDISLAKVESPYNFRDPVYVAYCSYAPSAIQVNYISNFEAPGTEAVTFGWGHKHYFRQDDDVNDQNTEYVNYASTVVINKELCQKLLVGHADMKIYVHHYLLCTSGAGNLDEWGKIDNTARVSSPLLSNSTTIVSSKTLGTNRSNPLYYSKRGPCQNDHGGPLITWIGGRAYVIGVACGFQVNKEMECVAPYLYSSTFSNREFINCVLHRARGSKHCGTPPKQRGYQILEEKIVWTMNIGRSRYSVVPKIKDTNMTQHQNATIKPTLMRQSETTAEVRRDEITIF